MSNEEYVQAGPANTTSAPAISKKRFSLKFGWVTGLVLMALLLIASFSMIHGSNINFDVDGDPVSGWQAVGLGVVGLTIALVAVVAATVMVLLTFAGISLMMLLLFSFVIALVLMATSPLWLPLVLIVAGLVWLFRTKT